MAQKYGSQHTMSNLYQDALAKNGVNVNPGMWGNLTSTDMNTLMTPTYKKQENDIKLAQQAATQEYRKLMAEIRMKELERKKYKDESDKQYKNDKLLADKQKNGKCPTQKRLRKFNVNLTIPESLYNFSIYPAQR